MMKKIPAALKPIKKVLDNPSLSISEKMTCIVLYMNAGNNGEITITTKELAELVGCSVRAVQGNINNLNKLRVVTREVQFVELENFQQTANKYILHFL